MRSTLTVLNQTTPPCYDLATVEDVNSALGVVGDTVKNAKTADQITAWSRVIASYCNRVFARQEVEEVFTASDNEALRLSRYPVESVGYVFVDDQELDESAYEVNSETGLLYLVPASNWYGRVSVGYAGGYDLPDGADPALKMACVEMVKTGRLTEKRDSAVRSMSTGDKSVTFFGAASATDFALSPTAASLVAPFIRYEG